MQERDSINRQAKEASRERCRREILSGRLRKLVVRGASAREIASGRLRKLALRGARER